MKYFAAYPSRPPAIGSCLNAASKILADQPSPITLHLWEENDIVGRPLVSPVLSEIEHSDIVVADITEPNFNVTFEIGYAIGISKRIVPIMNTGLERDKYVYSQIGVFDTLGHLVYENSTQLAKVLSNVSDNRSLLFSKYLDQNAPVFILETPARNDAMTRITARIKKARLRYRSFNPSEDARLAAPFAIEQVARSFGVIIPILSSDQRDHDIHNIRAAFVAGLAMGMNKQVLMLQDEAGPAPLDVRDFVKSFRELDQIDDLIHDFAFEVYELRNAPIVEEARAKDTLADLTIGDPMAENEFNTLGSYYLKTDEFNRSLRGEVNLVVGRKGTGKTALFAQLRDKIRLDKKNIVVDLKPEGYQLIKLKDEVLDYLADGSRFHLITAFWEYLLYMEVCYKVLEKDKNTHYRDEILHKRYLGLEELYKKGGVFDVRGDFSERLLALSELITEKYKKEFRGQSDVRLTTPQVTPLIYRTDLKIIKDKLADYLKLKGDVWILFDNLDKGWSADGVSSGDIAILRCLIDASRKLQQELRSKGVTCHSIVFIRNDIYELLVKKSADFGKELRAALEWHDKDLLREMMRRRFIQKDFQKDMTFDDIWAVLCTSHYLGQETSEFLIERSLMRPRNLLKSFSLCKGIAVNMGHQRIEADDIRKGMDAYSNDVLADANRELVDIEPKSDRLLYRFFEEKTEYKRSEIYEFIRKHGVEEARQEEILEHLLYYGFFGIRRASQEDLYIFDIGYDLNKMRSVIEKHENISFILNPAFHASLRVKW
jgi:hypothetical protein